MRNILNIRGLDGYCDTCDSKKCKTPYTRARGSDGISEKSVKSALHCECRKVSFQTTCCFSSNDVLFSIKRRVVSHQMTCCFSSNDVLFSIKRRVVFYQTTCCFSSNDVLFFLKRCVVFHQTTCCFYPPKGRNFVR